VSSFLEAAENGAVMVYAPSMVRAGRSRTGEWLYTPWGVATGEQRLQALVVEATLLPERSLRSRAKSCTGYSHAVERVLAIGMRIRDDHPGLWLAARDTLLAQFPFLAINDEERRHADLPAPSREGTS